MTRRSAPFVGRQAEGQELTHALQAARRGQPRFVLITAAAGQGKTALVDHVLGEPAVPPVGDPAPPRLLRIAGDETDTSRRFAPLRRLADRLGRRQPGFDARSWPLLAAGVPDDASDLAVGAEIVGLLGDLDPGRVVVLVVEDAHWLDPTSATALQFAVRRLTVERALIVVTTRGGTRLADLGWLRPAADPHLGGAVELGPLSEADVEQLVLDRHRARLAPAALSRLVQQTGGHPLHLRLVLDTATWEQLSAVTGSFPITPSLAAAVATGMGTLSDPARRVVAASAVLGRPADRRMLRELAGFDPEPAVDEAMGAGLLRYADGPTGRTVTLGHPLLTAAVRRALAADERRSIERAVCPHLTGDALLRHRIDATDGHDDALAAEVEQVAIARELAAENPAAIDLLLAASDLTAAPGPRARRFLRAVGLMASDGDLMRAFACREAALACPESDERTLVLAALSLMAGRLDDADGFLEQARHSTDLEPRLVASLHLLRATRAVVSGRAAQPDVRAVLANPAATSQWRSLARVLGAMSAMIEGRTEEALAFVATGPQVGTIEPFRIPIIAFRGGIHLWVGDHAAASADLAVVERLISAGRRVPALLPLSLGLIAEWQSAGGRWIDSLATVELLLAVEEGQSRAVERPLAHAIAARLLAEHGQTERALEQLAIARVWVDVLPSAPGRVHVALAGAVIGLVTDDITAALAALDEVDRPEIGFRRPERELLRAQALLRAGQLQVAGDHARRAAAVGGLIGARALLVSAEVALARRRPSDAETFLRAAGSSIPADNDWLRAREAQVRAQQAEQAGHREAATAGFSLARQTFVSLGAWPDADRCDRALSRLRGELSDEAAPVLLSDRELEVARLVALGLSNSQAAARLYVSRKAIEFHLTHVYAKLGITSRRQLAARLAVSSPAVSSPISAPAAPQRSDLPAQAPSASRDGDRTGPHRFTAG